MMREVPIPMVALVATAVSAATYPTVLTNMMNQMYAAIHEWRNGTQIVTEFSASAYLDVYRGHIGTFNYIKERRADAVHTILCDIYSQAR